MTEALTPIVQTDARGRAVLSGHRNQRFIMTDQSDGSVLLVPAVVVSQAQREYDESPNCRRSWPRRLPRPPSASSGPGPFARDGRLKRNRPRAVGRPGTGSPDVYDAVLDACELVFLAQGLAQARSTAIVTPDGVVLRLPVVGSPIKVFRSTWGPKGT